jgi:BASS family bile acid:Na+ symporter
VRRGLKRAAELLLPLALVAAGLGLLAPSDTLADRSDLVLAALVLSTALAIAPSQLVALRERKTALAALVFVPFCALGPLSWLVGRPFDDTVGDGVLALGVSSTEVAAVGLVALAGGSAVLALGALTGSLVLSALAGPPTLALLAGAGADIDVGELIARFALVVLLPLLVGLAIRALVPRLAGVEDELGGLAAIIVVVLVYAAMSGSDEDAELLSAALASLLFLLVSALPVLAWIALAEHDLRLTGAFVIELRDFAVAAALATQAFDSSAASVAGVYGVLMLLLGAAATQLAPSAQRRRSRPAQSG